MRLLKNILVTGGSGFIGTNFIRLLLEQTPDFTGRIINLDALTYAGNPKNLFSVEERFGISAGQSGEGKGRYLFVRADICDKSRVHDIFAEYGIDTVVHFAAESHVDRSILGPGEFIRTNIEGTFNLLEAARSHWIEAGTCREGVLFHHISTDEVYGSLGDTGLFTETTVYDPHSPYSASKAGSDHLVTAYHHTYGLPVTLSNCSNNYGPYQFPEKFIPLMILNMLEGKALPVYGDGKNIRDWLYVEDHVRAVWLIMNKGRAGQKYNIGGGNEWENIRLLSALIDIVADKAKLNKEKIKRTITFVKDRPGHDRRYGIDCSLLKKELGWKQGVDFEEGLKKTVDWYLENTEWITGIRTGEYKKWIDMNYSKRES